MIITLTAEQAALILDTEPSPALAWMQDQWRELLEQVLFGKPGVDEETGEHHWADIRLTPFDLYLAEVAKAGADWVLTDPEERTPLVPYQADLDWQLMQSLTPEDRLDALKTEFSLQGESLGLPSYSDWLDERLQEQEEPPPLL